MNWCVTPTAFTRELRLDLTLHPKRLDRLDPETPGQFTARARIAPVPEQVRTRFAANSRETRQNDRTVPAANSVAAFDKGTVGGSNLPSIQFFIVDADLRVQLAAFAFLDERHKLTDGLFDRHELQRGFILDGNRVPLLAPQGIFKPRVCRLPLSITTSITHQRREAPTIR